ncbi:hypothetical protein AMS68_005402 [Peltaster fructicola]|uniref:ATPase AAA-type core domain-containing protein n=1 Tax=Peltaster fructicola TaxID=286661 RepID=A0A6H0XYZ2_9PEZI|nr:hypothetical protein AMS68_005402 [Peltaster fructicola]
METFTILEKEEKSDFHLADVVQAFEAGRSADHDLQYVAALRAEFPDKIVTPIPQSNVNIVAYAHAGHAVIALDTTTDQYSSWKGYVLPYKRAQKAALGEAVSFAKFQMIWKETDFLVYLVQIGYSAVQYVLTDKKNGEGRLGPSNITDSLIMAAGDWQNSDNEVVWVYDMYWRQDKGLYNEVKKASWDKVILDENQKKELTNVSNTFFNSKKIYEDLGVPWKRGLLFHGPPGNGKTISIKALMHTLLFDRKESIPTLYVKNAPYTWTIGAVFAQARRLSPCMVVLEDVETIVTPGNRSYFFNEMDGLANNDGLFIVASTNYLDRLDPGLTKRPSRFDRKYLFPLPNEHERTLYCQYWQEKTEKNPHINFPKKLCPAMAHITPGFSFAFLQECFVATMLALAHNREDDQGVRDGDDDLMKYEIWRAFKAQADVLRKEIRDYGEVTLPSRSAPSSGQGLMLSEEQVRRHVDEAHRGTERAAGLRTLLDSEQDFKRAPLAFQDRKYPAISSTVYNWVAPYGYAG